MRGIIYELKVILAAISLIVSCLPDTRSEALPGQTVQVTGDPFNRAETDR